MPAIEAQEKNLRVCENCNATYVINGDESKYWCEIWTEGIAVEGLCEFCKEK